MSRSLKSAVMGVQVFAGVYAMVCLVATPPGFGLNECLLLWSFLLAGGVLMVQRVAPEIQSQSALACLGATVMALCVIALIDCFAGLGPALVLCFMCNMVACIVAVASTVAAQT